MKKWKLAAVCLLSISTLLSACGSKSSDAPSSTSSAKPAATEAAKKIDYPTKPIKLIVPFAAGGGTDVTARVLADVASKYLPNGQTLVVENKAGGGGTIGTAEVINAKPDGYTLGLTTIGPVSTQPLLGKTPYKYDDATPIINVVSTQNVLVVKKDSALKTFEDWLAYVKANPGKFTYSTPGAGIAPHLNTESVALATGTKVKNVPFDGTAPALTALLGGHVMGAVVQVFEAKPYIDSGDVIPLFVTGKSEYLPKVPTLKDKGVDVESELWTGVIGPKGLPDDIRDIVHDAIKKAMADPKVTEAFKKQGMEDGYANPADFKNMIVKDYNKYEKVVKAIGLGAK